jgi:uncharacterized repeat protein (TIGR02543 family)
VVDGNKATKPEDPTKTNYTFGGWYKEATLTTPWDFGTDTVTKNITLYAKWTATVTFEANGGTPVSGFPAVTEGDTITKPSPDPTKAGRTFGGWYKEAGLTTSWNFGTDKVMTNITLYAGWTPINYNITYNNLDGGSSGTNPAAYTIEQDITLAAVTRNGYTFEGWYSDMGFTPPVVTGIPEGSTGNVTLYAKWTRIRRPTP